MELEVCSEIDFHLLDDTLGVRGEKDIVHMNWCEDLDVFAPVYVDEIVAINPLDLIYVRTEWSLIP